MLKPGANIEIRAAVEAEMKDLDRVTRYAFANNTEPTDPPEPQPLQAAQTLCAFDGERMVATSGAFRFKMRLNGQAVAADGVTVVAADPGYRRLGIVRKLISGLLERSREDQVPISILWASMGAIYQRFGYGLATTSVSYDIEPRHMSLQFGERPAGLVRLLDEESALPLLKNVYQAYSEPGSGLLHRSTPHWGMMLRRENNQQTYIAVYFDPAGDPRGYVLYRTQWVTPSSPEPSQKIDVFDYAWLDMDAWRGLWLYLAGHDLANRVYLDFVAEDDPAPGLLLEPRTLKRRTWDGIWMRIVDVGQALEARGYQSDGEVTIRVVADELCPWNNGAYRVAVSDASVEVTRAAENIEADIIIDPNALASLLSGHSRPSDLARMGRLTVSRQEREAALDAFFASRRRPTCPNMF